MTKRSREAVIEVETDYESSIDSDDPEIIVNKILSHKKNKSKIEYYVKYTEGRKVKKIWVQAKNLLNCNELISDYWSDKIDQSEVDKAKVDIEMHDPFTEDTINVHESHSQSKNKRIKINAGDVVCEIENILRREEDQYLIKWVGSRTPTWISEGEFIERDMLEDFIKYENNRLNNDLQRRAYIYCRTSKRNSDKEISLYDQERYCLEFAKKHNINIIGVYRDNGVSARDMNNQRALEYITNRIRGGECILVYDVSRFSRSIMQALAKLEFLRKTVHAVVHSCHDGLTWNNIATNRENFRQNLSSAQLFSDVVSEKVKSSIEFRRQRGDHVGHVPYGYKTELKDGVRKLVLNPDEQKIIRTVLDASVDVVLERTGSMSLKSKQSKSNKKYLRERIADFSNAEYNNVAKIINNIYTYRNDKAFTGTNVKSIINNWKNKL